MARPDFDWTFEDAPLEGEARPESADRPGPASPRARRVRRPWPRWAWLTVLGLAAAALLGGYLFTRLGWLRLEGQIAAEVAYDDARSRGREVDAVLAAQVTNDAYWRRQRTAEVKLGLPAPLPAGNLTPTVYPAEVVAVEALGGNIFAATVRRRYADSAGQVVSFDLVQRYLNVAPGVWRRLGTELNGVVAATIVTGARLSATVPTNDLPWLTPALTAADGVLIDACNAWQTCPDGYQLALHFNVGPDLMSPVLPERPATPGGYPLIFDLPSQTPGYPPRYLLSAPQVVGRPTDATAQTAYNRSLSATLLGYMAGAVAGSARGPSEFFLDALVARMEVRLGLSAPAEQVVAPLLYRSADEWWALDATNRPAGVAERQQVLELMNVVLDGQPPEVDGALLRAVHRPDVPALEAWLAAALTPEDVTQARAAWVAHGQQGLQPPTVADWQAAEGLVLACPSRLLEVSQGVRRLLHPGFQPPRFIEVELGADLATDHYRAGAFIWQDAQSSRIEVWVFDQQLGGHAVLVSDNGYPLGWGADGGFYFVSFSAEATRLRRYDPVTLQTTTVLPEIRLETSEIWTGDHAALVYAQTPAGDNDSGASPVLMLLTLGPPVTHQVLLSRGSAATFAPDSTPVTGRLAYFSGSEVAGSTPRLQVQVLDLASGEARVVFEANKADEMQDGYGLAWSPGGKWLTFMTFPDGRIITVEAATGAWREWRLGLGGTAFYAAQGFSADDGYLAASTFGGTDLPETLVLLDLTAVGSEPVAGLNATDSAWSPTGHTLAITNALGVFLVDAATGAYRWLQAEPCDVSW